MIWNGRFKIAFWPFSWMKADTRIAEVISALIALSWAVILLLPGDTMHSAPGLKIMAEFGNDYVWAAIFGLVWGVQSLAMCGNIGLFRYPGALLSLMLWTFLASTILFSNPLSPGWLSYSVLALSMAWTLISGPTIDDSNHVDK